MNNFYLRVVLGLGFALFMSLYLDEKILPPATEGAWIIVHAILAFGYGCLMGYWVVLPMRRKEEKYVRNR